jgi:four helix bundle protein
LRFEKLEIWQNARALNQSVYRTIRTFPAEEHFALTSQIRRASISISSNIAEGAGRNSDKDFAHFLEQAYGSCTELASQLFLAFDEGYVSENVLTDMLNAIQGESAAIASLNRALSVKGSKVHIAGR